MEKRNQRDVKKSVLKPKKDADKAIKGIMPHQLKETFEELHAEEKDFEKVIHISRTTKVTKGGRQLSFGALVVVGNRRGNVGCGFGKSNEVPDAIKKGINDANKNFITVPLKGTTIPHEIIGRYGAAVILLKPAAEGAGVVAGNIIRAICEAAGIKDILTKCLKSQTPINVAKATLDGLKRLRHKNELLETEAEKI